MRAHEPHLVSRAGRIFLYFRWEEPTGNKEKYGRLARLSPTLLNGLGCAELFMTAVQAVQKDEVLQVESGYTSAALKTSLALQEWQKQSANHMKLSSFAHILIVRLRACFPCNYTSLQLRKERMWGAYHRLRTAYTFVGE